MTTSTTLPAETLSLQGPDALAFAQTQFSSQTANLSPGHWQWSAWLDPKGRVRQLFQLVRLAPDHLLLLLRGGSAQSLAQALQPFVFRSKLRIAAYAPRQLATATRLPLHAIKEYDEVLQLGCGDYSLAVQTQKGDLDWLPRQIQAGWSWLPEAAQNRHLGPALGLDRLQALALDKGCYPGQEIVARLHYRGGLKRHLTLIRSATPAEVAQLVGTNGDAGQLLHPLPLAAGEAGLAVLADGLESDAALELLRRWDAPTA